MTLSQTALLTFLTLFCFFVGTFVVLEYKPREFHEVAYRPKVIIDSILSAYERGVLPLPEAYDTSDNQDIVREEIKYRRHLMNRLPDSVVRKMFVEDQLFVNRDSFKNDCLIKAYYGDKISVKDSIERVELRKAGKPRPRTKVLWDYYFNYSYKYNKPIHPYHLQRFVRMPAINYEYNMDFFTKYPGFLLWSLLIILQYGLFPVLTLCAWVLIIDFKNRFPKIYKKKDNKRQTFKYALLSGAILIVFMVIGFQAFFNPNLIKSGLFHRDMSIIMITVSILTCLAGNACFTGFMVISGSSFKLQSEGEVNDEDIELLNEMNELFSRLLIICSIILCIIVLTTGALYNSLNKMDFIKKVTSDLGYSPLGYHYAILFAALCSIILLLFFIPAKLRLLAIEDRLREIKPDENRISTSADVFGIAKSVLVVGLPLITGVMQSIFSALTK